MPKFQHALCINPYLEESSGAMGFFPPTGLEYIATALATAVPRVTIADLRHDFAFRPEARLHEFIRREGVDLLAVSVNWEFKFDEALGLVSRLPPGIFTIVGGQEATARVDEVLSRCPRVDAVARCDGEEIVMELASGMPLAEIRGLSHRRNGSLVHNENRSVGALADIPVRDRSLRRVRYGIRRYGVTFIRGVFDTVLTSRGCPFNCKFCSFNRNPLGKKRDYEELSAEAVFDEVKSLEADIVFFVDDNMFVNPGRIERLCDLLIAGRVKKRYLTQARVDIGRYPRLLDKLEAAGFKALLLGVESAQDRILKALNKGYTTDQLRKYALEFKKHDLLYHGYFIIGNIGETEEDMLSIPSFAEEVGLDSISYLKLRALRFTSIPDLVRATPGYHTNARGFVYSDRYSLDDLRRIGRKIRRAFYTPRRMVRLVGKAVRIGFASKWDLAAAPVRALCATINRKAEKKMRAKAEAKSAAAATVSTPK